MLLHAWLRQYDLDSNIGFYVIFKIARVVEVSPSIFVMSCFHTF